MVECNNSLVDSEMRSVAFVEHQKYEIHGTICTKAITLGDVDNDGVSNKFHYCTQLCIYYLPVSLCYLFYLSQANELITGSILGELAVFKGNKRWWKCTDLGIVSILRTIDYIDVQSLI